MRPVTCQCGSAVRVRRDLGLCGEKGWSVEAMCGNKLFSPTTRTDTVVHWNMYGYKCSRKREDFEINER